MLANIRGGGEFGESWHQGAVKANHVHAYEDFEAVAADLIDRKVTSKAHLGIEGRSNGGLLVLSTMERRPDLYGAVICGSPLADMRRYHQLLAGASWMDEYGDPDKPEEWAWIAPYSPYQNAQRARATRPSSDLRLAISTCSSSHVKSRNAGNIGATRRGPTGLAL